ncbi:triple gene block 1-like protein [Ribes americanum virus A]|uniref:Triple gene block 1-like protein n=1 Tax=Ribes americanum virus A TaxID=1569057 RepID=A0A345F6V3_9VIRU|nr:triple gene block 1-like protein [Ribes americanum virus A]AXG24094.1 triple gene block 1-like protein [Ribes americanum virus A]
MYGYNNGIRKTSDRFSKGSVSKDKYGQRYNCGTDRLPFLVMADVSKLKIDFENATENMLFQIVSLLLHFCVLQNIGQRKAKRGKIKKKKAAYNEYRRNKDGASSSYQGGGGLARTRDSQENERQVDAARDKRAEFYSDSSSTEGDGDGSGQTRNERHFV